MISATTHLNFPGTAREALEFYGSVFDGTVTLSTYADFGMPADAPGADRIVFGRVERADGFRLLGYDIPGETVAASGWTRRENGVTLTDRPFFQSLSADSLDELTGYWTALSDGAEIVEPLAASAWSSGFGMLTDRFGVTWTLDVRAA